ncbi:MAG: SDR family NAD(P)-dependent oxidoreductase [Janthinobacterium lividum]
MIKYDFSGRHALVTGAASGIGAAVALRLLEAGAHVTACDLNGAGLDEHFGQLAADPANRVERRILDVSNHGQVQTLFTAVDNLRPVDILVHAAAIAATPAPIAETEFDDWQRIIAVNLTGTFNINKAAVRCMLQHGYGRIVNFGSVSALEGTAQIASYAASKAAVASLTLSLAKETAAHDIAVNCIVPAGVRTPMVGVVDSNDGGSDGGESIVTRRIARKRLAETSEVADAVLWLCSSENSFTTGQAFNFAGART